MPGVLSFSGYKPEGSLSIRGDDSAHMQANLFAMQFVDAVDANGVIGDRPVCYKKPSESD